MEIYSVFRPFWHQDKVEIAKRIFNELNNQLSNIKYISSIQLDEVGFLFINTEAMKCRVRSDYRAVQDMSKDPNEPYSLMALFFEIPLPESDFIKVSEEDLPTYIGKALLNVLETRNVPVKIRKQFDRERFISDVRDFFVNVKGCRL